MSYLSLNEFPLIHPNLSKDGEGYVYWRGKNIEHYSFNGESGEANERTAATDLAKHCQHLEAIGVPVNGNTAAWFATWFPAMQNDYEYKSLAMRCPGIYENDKGQLLFSTQGVYILWDGNLTEWVAFTPPEPDNLGSHYHALVAAGWHLARADQGADLGVMYTTLDGLTALFRKYNIPSGTKFPE